MKKIKLFDRWYEVTPEGRIYNQYSHIMTQMKDKDGYHYIAVKKGQQRKKYYVHRLVAELYIENPSRLPQVNHIDGDKTNNNYMNLEWVNNSQNQTHSRYILGNQTGFKDTPVICVETNKRYISTREAWRDTGANYSHISECVRGKRKTAGGRHWRSA